ncbi:adhesion G-protein coupled receptor d1 [Plakobranchus ocellatus]|uniref:Adhesion G-protein coupled receptor d1 n=1 Tax=Plakobranchus ocellatus TaxID=259542 RepID=A0AAV4D9P0_9GAST|nr:adhesion G-protein coupled receptor d1 [Plakobranchus ocellatus]
MPVHFDGELQEIASPYVLVFNSTTYGTTPLKLTVSAVGPSERDFMAFMLQARSEFGEPAGHFSQAPVASKPMTCYNTDDTLTHTAAFIRPSMEVLWHPPSDNIGKISIICGSEINLVRMKKLKSLFFWLFKICYLWTSFFTGSSGGPTVPACAPVVGWVQSANQRSLYLSDTGQPNQLLTWQEALRECSSHQPGVSLASFPRDTHDQTISCKITPSVPYWVGMSTTYPTPAQIYWLDGSLETRASQFSTVKNLSKSLNQTCGQVHLTIHSAFHRPLDWTLAECSSRQPFICMADNSWLTAAPSVTQHPTNTSNGILKTSTAATTSSQSILKHIHEKMGELKCISSLTPLKCLVSKAAAAYHTGLNFSERERADIIALANLVIEHLRQLALKATQRTMTCTALLNFLHAVNARLQMINTDDVNLKGNENIPDVLHWTEDFLDEITQSGLILSNSSLTLTHVALSLVHVQLHALPGLDLRVGDGMIVVENFTLNRNFTGMHHLLGSTSAFLYNHTVSDPNAVLVAAVLMNVPRLAVRTESGKAFVNSPVLSLSAAARNNRISLDHTFHIPTITRMNDTLFTCGFQSQNKSAEEVWSTFGCQYIGSGSVMDNRTQNLTSELYNWKKNSDNRTTSIMQSRCRCNHTTNFAILMSVVNLHPPRADRLALSVVTYIGCSASIISMVVAITVFCCLRSLNSERVCVHRNLCIAVLAAQLTFISGINAVEEPRVCVAVALLLHYLVTSSLVWMLVEGLHLYCQVVSVFGTGRARMKYYTAFGWGMPAVLVGVSAAVDWQGYGTKYSCWLSVERSTVWVFVGPAVAIITINSVILVSVIRIVVGAANRDKVIRFAPVRAGARAGLFLCPLMGLTWIFGLAAVSKELIVFQYIFSALNSLQGFFIFLFHCVLNTEVKQTLRRMKEKRSLQKGEFPPTPTTSHGQSSSLDSGSPPESSRASPRPAPFFRRINRVSQYPSGLNKVL